MTSHWVYENDDVLTFGRPLHLSVVFVSHILVFNACISIIAGKIWRTTVTICRHLAMGLGELIDLFFLPSSKLSIARV